MAPELSEPMSDARPRMESSPAAVIQPKSPRSIQPSALAPESQRGSRRHRMKPTLPGEHGLPFRSTMAISIPGSRWPAKPGRDNTSRAGARAITPVSDAPYRQLIFFQCNSSACDVVDCRYGSYSWPIAAVRPARKVDDHQGVIGRGAY